MSPVHKLSQIGSLTGNKIDYPSMLAGYGDFGAIQRIASVTLTSNGGLTFTNIPQTYQDLFLVASARGLHNADLEVILLDWGYVQDHSFTAVRGSATTIDSYRGTAAYGIYCNSIPGATAASNIYGTVVAHILNYTSTTARKQALVRNASDLNGSGVTVLTVGMKNTNAAITSLQLSGGNNAIVAGSTAALYGIKASAA